MCDNHVYDLTAKIEAIKVFIREQFYVIKKYCWHYKPIEASKQSQDYRTSSGTNETFDRRK